MAASKVFTPDKQKINLYGGPRNLHLGAVYEQENTIIVSICLLRESMLVSNCLTLLHH